MLDRERCKEPKHKAILNELIIIIIIEFITQVNVQVVWCF